MIVRHNGRTLRENWTLKHRIIVIFIASSLISFVSIALVSNYAINSLLENKIQNVIQSNLKQVQLSLENTIANLNHISQQLSYQGSVGKKLDRFLSEHDSFERAQLVTELQSELNIITFTNPSIGLTMYYLPDGEDILFNNYPVKEGFEPNRLPFLAKYFGITYYGPHQSNDRFNNEYVLSAMREIVLPSRDHVFVYIESGFNLTQNLLDNERLGKNSFHLIVDNSGRIAYSEMPDILAIDSVFFENGTTSTMGKISDYYWFKGTSNQGWSIVSVIPNSEYNKEKNLWVTQIVLFSLLILAVSLLFALFLWKMVYKPLTSFQKEIKWMGFSELQPNPIPTKIPEFDRLILQFRQMKEEIGRLFLEVEHKEKRRADLEIEKVLYQINPHFLLNTLDTAHWLAVLNGQTEIDRLIVSLNKLLAYNLRKSGQLATVQEELDALKEYLVLQQIRYDFEFNVKIQADERVLNIAIPRFILQPLVENALYHGLNDDGFIQVDVGYDKGIIIKITDNGAGMSEETIRHLLESDQKDQRGIGLGIGMNYVKRVLAAHYNGRAEIEIQSKLGDGTTVRLLLPKSEGELK